MCFLLAFWQIYHFFVESKHVVFDIRTEENMPLVWGFMLIRLGAVVCCVFMTVIDAGGFKFLSCLCFCLWLWGLLSMALRGSLCLAGLSAVVKLEQMCPSCTVGPGSILHLLILSQSWGLHNRFHSLPVEYYFPFPSTPIPGFCAPNLFLWSTLPHLLCPSPPPPVYLKRDIKALGRAVNRIGSDYLPLSGIKFQNCGMAQFFFLERKLLLWRRFYA